MLAGGYVVNKRLGSGSVSIVYLVDLIGDEQVLKVTRASQYNARVKEEFEVLQTIQEKVRSRIVVAPFKLLDFGELVGSTMESAGEKTPSRFVREEGMLDLTYLQRFGDDLLRTIRDLDDAGGIAHRDLRPENMGIRTPGKKQNQLCLFDFSLSKVSPVDISVGTPGYLDPFISERKVKRWDISSECFSAAMTLHEMATGVLPTWGEGKNIDPASIRAEVTILSERFDPDLRDRFVRFFEKALRRDHRQRFDNPDEILKAWSNIFATIDARKKSRTTRPSEDELEPGGLPYQLPDLVTPGTQLILLGLSTRLLNTLDRLNLVTVSDLLDSPCDGSIDMQAWRTKHGANKVLSSKPFLTVSPILKRMPSKPSMPPRRMTGRPVTPLPASISSPGRFRSLAVAMIVLRNRKSSRPFSAGRTMKPPANGSAKPISPLVLASRANA